MYDAIQEYAEAVIASKHKRDMDAIVIHYNQKVDMFYDGNYYLSANDLIRKMIISQGWHSGDDIWLLACDAGRMDYRNIAAAQRIANGTGYTFGVQRELSLEEKGNIDYSMTVRK